MFKLINLEISKHFILKFWKKPPGELKLKCGWKGRSGEYVALHYKPFRTIGFCF